jgi:hypothetical protein
LFETSSTGKRSFAIRYKGNAGAKGVIATAEALVEAAPTAIGVAENKEWAATATIGVAETNEWAAISANWRENAVIACQSTLIATDFSVVAVAIAAKWAGIFSGWGATATIATAKAAIAGANSIHWVGENPQFAAIWHIGPDGCSIASV